MLAIIHPTRFGTDDLPLRGQCQPHSPGWRFCIVKKGEPEVLHENNFFACRELMLRCRGKDEATVRRIAEEAAPELVNDLEDTQVMDGSPQDTLVVADDEDLDETAYPPAETPPTAFILADREDEDRVQLVEAEEDGDAEEPDDSTDLISEDVLESELAKRRARKEKTSGGLDETAILPDEDDEPRKRKRRFED